MATSLRLPIITFFLLYTTLLASSFPVQGQSSPSNTAQLPLLPKIMPPSPTAAALAKYAEIPVSTYTGVPNISIPLYEIKVRDLTVPISLSYHAGGHRVDEEASWVGLGWTLNAGGAITRTVRGRDDLDTYYWHSFPMPALAQQTNFGYSLICLHCRNYFVDEYNGSEWDPDAFFFNFLSYSGKFILDEKYNVQLLDQQKIRLELVRNTDDRAFKVWTADGTQYEFFTLENTTTLGTPTTTSTTTWYLSKITSSLGEEVTFRYERGPNAVMPLQSISEVRNLESVQCSVTGDASGCRSVPKVDGAQFSGLTQTNVAYLSRIEFKTGYVTFERDTQPREDLKGGQRLKSVKVYQTGVSIPIREFELSASYAISPLEYYIPYVFPETNSTNYSVSADEHSRAGKRLRLDRLQEKSEKVAKPAYEFTYNATPLPYKTSYARDHWGFYNGKNNRTLAPTFKGKLPLSGEYKELFFADREADADKVKAGLLEQIRHPTGGTTRFTYESNDYQIDPAQAYVDRTYSAYATRSQTESAGSPTLTVVEPNTTVRVTIDLRSGSGCTGECLYRTSVVLKKKDNSWTRAWTLPLPEGSGGHQETTVIVPTPGEYMVEANVKQGDPQSIQASIIASYTRREPDPNPPYKKIGGGVRIARIVDHNSINASQDIVREYSYERQQQTASGLKLSSHGVLMSQPRYERSKEKHYSLAAFGPGNGEICQAFQLCSYSMNHLSSAAKGSTVGYSQVEERRNAGGVLGKTVYTYHNLPDRVEPYVQRLPNVPTQPEPLNGYLTGQTDYAYTMGRFRKVKESVMSYDGMVNQRTFKGVLKELDYANLCHAMLGYAFVETPLHVYTLYSQWIQLKERQERLFNPQDESKYTESITRYAYGPEHMQISRVETRRSNGATLITENKYPADYTSVATGALAEMRANAVHQHDRVVESVTKVYKAGQTETDAKVIAGIYTEYGKVGNRYLPIAVRALDLAQPTAGLSPAAPALPPASRYVLKQQLAYDPATGNLTQAQRFREAPTSYVWGYGGTLPLAQVVNATQTEVQAALQAAGLNPENVRTDAQVQAALAQLRQRLPQARVTGLAHNPLVGPTSQTDVSGRPTAYEYDALGRLVRVKDERSRILSENEYQYARP